MSDEEAQKNGEEQVLTAEYKDGQLQIVEVTPFDKNDGQNVRDMTTGQQTKYLQVLDNKSLMQLDLLNFTLVKCDNNENSFQMVGASSDDGDTTVTCVLSTEDSEGDNDNQDTYVVLNSEEGHDPLVFLQSSLQQIHQQQSLRNKDANIKPLTPAELLEKAKALQKAKALLQVESTSRSNRGRKRKAALPPPMEMLTSPNFKLFLYSCKMCNFKCNAIKEMSSHKATEHVASKTKPGGAGRSGGNLQCARCPYRATAHSQLMKHVESEHLSETHVVSEELNMDGDASEADVLVCGACGFESSDGNLFQQHVQKDHGVSVMLKGNLLSVDDDTSQSD